MKSEEADRLIEATVYGRGAMADYGIPALVPLAQEVHHAHRALRELSPTEDVWPRPDENNPVLVHLQVSGRTWKLHKGPLPPTRAGFWGTSRLAFEMTVADYLIVAAELIRETIRAITSFGAVKHEKQ